jgi:hypothetical protein
MPFLAQSRFDKPRFGNTAYLFAAMLAICGSAAVQSTAFAQTSYPMVMSLNPVAVQAGASGEVEFNSRYSMFGANQVLISGDGVKGEVLHPEVKKGAKPPSLTKIKVKFTVEPNALLGARDVKLMTPQGVSTVGQLVIVRDPVFTEKEGNNTKEKAQEIKLPATICGAIGALEDVDYFKFSVKAGTALSFHMRSARLQDRIHDLQRHVDPMITLRHANGSTIAACDNYFFGDPFLSHKFTHDGEYLLEIRDVRYSGNVYWQYSVEITNQPFVENVFPLGITIAKETPVEMIGVQLPGTKVSVNLPGDLQPGPKWVPLSVGKDRTNPAPIFATKLETVTETAADNNAPAGGQQVSVPGGINGRIDQSSDVDCYRFEAKKGEKYTFEVRARRYQSSLDPYIRLLNADGKQLSENDDLKEFKRNFADSRIENWTVPADGTYALEIRDMHLRGGPNFVYFIEATKAEPHFRLYADTDKTLLSPGMNGVFFVQVERKNGFTGDVKLHVDGLPKGVEAICGRILPDKAKDGCIILRAAKDAKVSCANITIRGTSTWKPAPDAKPLELAATAFIYQETYQPGGGRGHWPVDAHTVSIGAPTDIRGVKLSDYDVVLKPGESKKIEVTVERAEGFDKNVSLDMLFQHLGVFCNTLPPGVKFDESKSSKLITGKSVTGTVVLTADATAAEIDRQLVPVTANVSLNFVMKTSFSADPLWVSVKK